MKAIAVHRDALVVTSRLWQTTATAMRAGEESMLVDSPYFPDELEALPELLAQSGFSPSGLLATHADFDHLLGRAAFPRLALGLAESSALRLQAEPGAAQREMRRQDDELYVERPRPLSLGQLQPLPVPGKLELGPTELELHPAEGHVQDGMAIFAPEHRLLLCGDYLSPVEIPMISPGGSLDAYTGTLARLAGLVDRADHFVPGHGSPLRREQALAILDEDGEYLESLRRGEERPRLPSGRDTSRQRQIHTANLSAT